MGLAIIGKPTPLSGYLAQHYCRGRRSSALAIPPEARIHLPVLAFPSVTCGEYWQEYVSVSRNDGIA
jgi:hypothetical protein